MLAWLLNPVLVVRIHRLQRKNRHLQARLAACRAERDELVAVVARNHRRVLSETQAWPVMENRNAV